MKTLRLTILLRPNVSKAQLKNVFGEFTEVQGRVFRYAVFEFPSVKMFSRIALKPISDLIDTFELQTKLQSKTLSMVDSKDGSYGPNVLIYSKGVWTMESATKDIVTSTSRTLLGLF